MDLESGGEDIGNLWTDDPVQQAEAKPIPNKAKVPKQVSCSEEVSSLEEVFCRGSDGQIRRDQSYY